MRSILFKKTSKPSPPQLLKFWCSFCNTYAVSTAMSDYLIILLCNVFASSIYI